MSTPQQRIWIDMTDMSSWRGHFTGTQRVAYEVASRFNKQGQQTSFFVYDDKTRGFYEISFEDIEATINPAPVTPSADEAPRRHRPSVKNVAKAQSIRLYHNLPFSIKQRITPAHKDLAKTAYHRLRSVSHRIRPVQSATIKHATQASAPLTFTKHDTVVILGKPWDTMSFIDVLRQQKIDNNFKLVNLVYDMIPVYLPHLFGKPLPENYTKYMFDAISISDVVVAISESTKRDIVRFCRDQLLPVPKILVTKLGNTIVSASDNTISDVADLSGKEFILSVGTIENRKNHILLYTAYRQAVLEGVSLPDLVIIGGVGSYTTDVLYEFANDPELNQRVHVMHRITDNELDWLYRHCAFTAYPSVYEGWGLPIAESLAYGKVCVASHTSSMTEIAGDLIEYFSPYDSVACLRLLQKYSDPAIRAKKEQEIKKNYDLVSWDEPFSQVQLAVKQVRS